MLHMIWTLIIGAVIGALASVIANRDMPLGWVGNIIGGLVGAWLGQAVLGSWGLHVAGMAIFPAIIGAIVVVLITSWLFGRRKRA